MKTNKLNLVFLAISLAALPFSCMLLPVLWQLADITFFPIYVTIENQSKNSVKVLIVGETGSGRVWAIPRSISAFPNVSDPFRPIEVAPGGESSFRLYSYDDAPKLYALFWTNDGPVHETRLSVAVREQREVRIVDLDAFPVAHPDKVAVARRLDESNRVPFFGIPFALILSLGVVGPLVLIVLAYRSIKDDSRSRKMLERKE